MYIILFVQIAILIFKVKKDKNIKKTIKIILCYLFGILAFFCMLIGLGKIFDGDYGVTHKDLYVMYSMILCSFNLALLNLIIRYNLIKDLFIGIIMIISSIYLVKNNFFYYKDTIKFVMKPWMIEVYKAEKIIRLANLKQKTIFLDKKLFDDSYNWALFQEFNEREENTLYKESPYITYLNQFEKENKIIQCFIFTDTETVKKEFSKNGGLFTEEELNNIDFNRLKDKNFVLNYKE
ncbi:MAG: hypothetical protein IJY61_00625 [Candidatus Gastranaerophilales bacterium]|nr:hypothetical protein [Candidatus Gastranaerophilales bacterium]